MTADSRALLPMLWLLACENEDPASGSIPYSYEEITFRLRMSYETVTECLTELQRFDFIECIQSVTDLKDFSNEIVTPETETETETETDIKSFNNDAPKYMVKLWNDFAKKNNLAQVAKLTKTRQSKAVARLKDCGGLGGWEIALDKITQSQFLLGENDRGWKADFDFMLKESSFTKLMEDGYKDGKKNGASNGWLAAAQKGSF